VGATLGVPNTAVLTIIDNDIPASPVSVIATAGTTGPTPYNTLKEAVDAVNAGTHQGFVTININASTVEAAAPIVLNSSGAGSASYTSLFIRPTADRT
jgi:molybdopterin biosynthesis enzyme MoaB